MQEEGDVVGDDEREEVDTSGDPSEDGEPADESPHGPTEGMVRHFETVAVTARERAVEAGEEAEEAVNQAAEACERASRAEAIAVVAQSVSETEREILNDMTTRLPLLGTGMGTAEGLQWRGDEGTPTITANDAEEAVLRAGAQPPLRMECAYYNNNRAANNVPPQLQHVLPPHYRCPGVRDTRGVRTVSAEASRVGMAGDFLCQQCFYVIQAALPSLRGVWDDTMGAPRAHEVPLPVTLDVGSDALREVETESREVAEALRDQQNPGRYVPPAVVQSMKDSFKEFARQAAHAQPPVFFSAANLHEDQLTGDLLHAAAEGVRKGVLERRHIDRTIIRNNNNRYQ